MPRPRLGLFGKASRCKVVLCLVSLLDQPGLLLLPGHLCFKSVWPMAFLIRHYRSGLQGHERRFGVCGGPARPQDVSKLLFEAVQVYLRVVAPGLGEARRRIRVSIRAGSDCVSGSVATVVISKKRQVLRGFESNNCCRCEWQLSKMRDRLRQLCPFLKWSDRTSVVHALGLFLEHGQTTLLPHTQTTHSTHSAVIFCARPAFLVFH